MKRSDTARPSVIYDPNAVTELLVMKSKEEHRALLNAVRKLGELGEQLGPPHEASESKPSGESARAATSARTKRLARDLSPRRRLLRDPRHRSAQELREPD
jgi:hypothetical protein